MIYLLLVIVLIIVLFNVAKIRMLLISKPVFSLFKKMLPTLSPTEQEAMEAGDIWWEAELFQGSPDWKLLHSFCGPQLTSEEKSFIDNELRTALEMLDDYQIVHSDKDLPPALWDYFRKHGFFSFIIPKEYGGKAFSAYAISVIVSQLASRSISASVTVMVPNSLGPGELLTHYGTSEQKSYWLPKLASGECIPCFALTAPEAGSDAGAIPDTGVVCKGMFEGKEMLGLRLTWNKRYITLAPIADVLGLAFKVEDPDGLLGNNPFIGITCALIPTSHIGVNIGKKHNPLNLAFMNGTTTGKDVFIPIDWIIGGALYAGHGWRMLVECLSAGRGVSLPAVATATAHLATKTTTAYAAIRKQFGLPIIKFEGIQEPLARIISNTYQLEAARSLTTTALDLKLRPAIVTAIAKYHMTELGREVINDAMDVHAGKGIQLGPNNYLGYHYIGAPISITVEGANILTRSLMIFGQGATRCHPYILAEMDTVSMENQEQALQRFDALLSDHIHYSTKNAVRAFFHAITGSRFANSPVSGGTRHYYKHMSRLSAALAIATDVSMLILGGELKRKEMLSARLGDVLSQLYLASATLKMFEDNGRQFDELAIVQHTIETRLFSAAVALKQAINNFPHSGIRLLLNIIIFPLGNRFKLPSDNSTTNVVESMTTPSVARDRLTFLCPDINNSADSIGKVERAFIKMSACKPLLDKIKAAEKAKSLKGGLSDKDRYKRALASSLITETQYQQLVEADELCSLAIQVDVFD